MGLQIDSPKMGDLLYLENRDGDITIVVSGKVADETTSTGKVTSKTNYDQTRINVELGGIAYRGHPTIKKVKGQGGEGFYEWLLEARIRASAGMLTINASVPGTISNFGRRGCNWCAVGSGC